MWITTNCAKFLKRSEYQSLYESREATVRTRHGTVDWFKIGKGVCQGCILSPFLFSLHAEYIMQNAGLDDSQAGIKTARKNINILRFAPDTTQMAEHKEELKSLLKRVKEESEKAGLKLSIQETKILTSGPIILWQIEGGKEDIVTDFIFLGSKFTAGGDCSHEIKRLFLLGRKAMPNSDKFIIKQRHHFAGKGPYSQSYVWIIMYGCETWTLKKAKH